VPPVVAEAAEMSNVAALTFEPDLRSTVHQNLLAFISHCRHQLKTFGEVPWETSRWNIGSTVRPRGRSTDVNLNWTDIDSKQGNHKRNKPFAQPFAEFAKAFIRYRYAHRPTSDINGTALFALRALEKALLEKTKHYDVCLVDSGVLNRAAELSRARWPGSSHHVGRWLEEIGELLKEKRMANRTIQWRNPNATPADTSLSRVGREADERRAKKLPSDTVLHAVAAAFNEAVEPRDVVVSSIAAILACSPDRLSEVVSLHRDAEVNSSLDGKPSYGLRWFPSKGAKPMVKPIPRVMEDVARKAMSQLLSATATAHEMAVWYARHSDRMYLPPNLAHLRDQEDLTLREAAELLGMSKGSHAAKLLREKASDIVVKKTDGSLAVSFEGLERHVLSTLPRGFPIMDQLSELKYEDALCVVPVRFFVAGSPSQVMFMPVTWDTITRVLGNGSSKGHTSIFTRLDLRDEHGKHVRIRSHQFRHWLNTLARKGGMSELEIALWSGRKDIRSNSAYDHLTVEESLALVRTVKQADNESLVEFVVREPVSRTEFDVLKIKTGHATEFGVCTHDYAMAPCQKHRDCINCEEQVCVKGDKESNQRIRTALEITEALHKKAIEALADNHNGAGRWEQHHHGTLRRLRGLVAILDDPERPEGTIIRLSNTGNHSILDIALEEHRALTQVERDAWIQDIRLYHAGRSEISANSEAAP
jgi:hypothetical protein